ncbi:MAG: DUF1592 domain-containing protein [bacterium]
MRRHLPLACLLLGTFACEEAAPPEAPPFLPPPVTASPSPPPRPVCDPTVLPDPGPALVRRLSRVEYDNTARDLLGEDTDVATQFAREEEMLGFDNNARALQVGALHAEQFMGAAELLAARAARRLDELLPCDPDVIGERECAVAFIDTFGRKAWRRPLTPEELDRLALVYDAARAMDAAPFADGVTLVIEELLQSPNFLYRIEVGTPHPTRPGIQVLEGYEVASRLSYLLWRSMPDDDLFDAASRDALASPTDLADQARRMLADPRAREGLWSFFEQWLRLDEVAGLEKDAGDFPFFDEDLKALLHEESRQFVEAVIWDDTLDMRDLFAGSFTFLNDRLAEFYGIDGVQGADLRRVELDPRQRAGILTQGALMAVTSKARITSPVRRGVFVREHILCHALPPPPPNVPVIAPDPDPNLTTRERFAEHSTGPACKGCHQLIDPVGFAFEHYDAVGRWRDLESGHPVDASGALNATLDIDGPFDGAPEVARRLAQSEQVHRCVTTQVFRYAFGRGENPVDGCTQDGLYNAYVASGYDVRALFVAAVMTDTFRLRRAEPDEAPPAMPADGAHAEEGAVMDRRTFLRRAAGAALALPLLQLPGRARAQLRRAAPAPPAHLLHAQRDEEGEVEPRPGARRPAGARLQPRHPAAAPRPLPRPPGAHGRRRHEGGRRGPWRPAPARHGQPAHRGRHHRGRLRGRGRPTRRLGRWHLRRPAHRPEPAALHPAHHLRAGRARPGERAALAHDLRRPRAARPPRERPGGGLQPRLRAGGGGSHDHAPPAPAPKVGARRRQRRLQGPGGPRLPGGSREAPAPRRRAAGSGAAPGGHRRATRPVPGRGPGPGARRDVAGRLRPPAGAAGRHRRERPGLRRDPHRVAPVLHRPECLAFPTLARRRLRGPLPLAHGRRRRDPGRLGARADVVRRPVRRPAAPAGRGPRG